MSKLLRVTTYGTRLLPQQNQNPTRHRRAGAGVHVRTAHWLRRKRMCQCVTSRCGRSDTLGPYSSNRRFRRCRTDTSFGRRRLHTVAEDTLGKLCSQATPLDYVPLESGGRSCCPSDPDDLIFPRATTRAGPKYQAPIPAKDCARDPGRRLFLVVSRRTYNVHVKISKNVAEMRR